MKGNVKQVVEILGILALFAIGFALPVVLTLGGAGVVGGVFGMVIVGAVLYVALRNGYTI